MDHEKGFIKMASTSSAARVNTTEKPLSSQDQSSNNNNNQQVLKCPRCDSSNTKFCYYNNYSLSQPRHFCKACKRYWTRGGTLRSVPVGGGCRKNKKVKTRPPPTSSSIPNNIDATSSTSLASSCTITNPNLHNQMDLPSNPVFYGLSTNHSELTLPYPSRFSSRVESISGFDHPQPHDQLSAFRSGFSSGLLADHEVITSDALLSSYSMFGSSASSTSPTIASLLSSSLDQQKLFSCDSMRESYSNGFQRPVPYELGLQMGGSSNGMALKEEKADPNKFEWNLVPNFQNQMEHINPSTSDPSLYWNAQSNIGTNIYTWLDPTNNIGSSSVPSLI